MKLSLPLCVSVLGAFLCLSQAGDPQTDQYCFEGCVESFGKKIFAGTPTLEDGYYPEFCGNALHLQSLYLCARKFCTNHEIERGFEYNSGICEENGETFPSVSVVDNYTTEDIEQLDIIEYGEGEILAKAATFPHGVAHCQRVRKQS